MSLGPRLFLRGCTTKAAAFWCRNKPVVMELLLKKSTSAMNVVNKAGRTSLHVAVCKQHVDCVRVLLNYHCDVNVQVAVVSASAAIPGRFKENLTGGAVALA